MNGTAFRLVKGNTGARVGRVLSWGDMANPRRRAVVVEVAEGRSYTIGSRGLRPSGARMVIVFDDLRLSEASEAFIDGNAWRWEDTPDLSPSTCADLLQLAREKRDAEAKERERAFHERAEAEKAFEAEIAALRPPWAKAVLVAVQDIDDCDLLTDYFSHRDGRRVLLAWSKHNRDLFPEMRKAAARCEHTRHLVDADKEAEHREKYSMGDGYYLKTSHCDASGWRVEKASIETETRRRRLYPADLSLLKGAKD